MILPIWSGTLVSQEGEKVLKIDDNKGRGILERTVDLEFDCRQDRDRFFSFVSMAMEKGRKGAFKFCVPFSMTRKR